MLHAVSFGSVSFGQRRWSNHIQWHSNAVTISEKVKFWPRMSEGFQHDGMQEKKQTLRFIMP